MLGVLGGMGPLATVDFVRKVVQNTSADCDQHHIPTLVCSASNIPDRTAAIVGEGPDPLPAMLDALRRLERAGATFIAIACNTAHNWHGALQEATSVPILHIADAVLDELISRNVREGIIGILATTGTLQAGIYQDRLSRHGFACRLPARQDEVMRAIRLVKAGRVGEAGAILRDQVSMLISAGCRCVVLACTEIPVALDATGDDLRGVTIDATDALSRACVDAYTRGSGAREAGSGRAPASL
jgi:aspartate racemase